MSREAANSAPAGRKMYQPTPKPGEERSDPRYRGFSYNEWKAWWNALTEPEKQSLRDLAEANHKSLSYCAVTFGAAT